LGDVMWVPYIILPVNSCGENNAYEPVVCTGGQPLW